MRLCWIMGQHQFKKGIPIRVKSLGMGCGVGESGGTKMKQLVTETPEGNDQYLHNMTMIKDAEVFLRDFNGEGDINLVEYCKRECKAKCDIDQDGEAIDFAENMGCNCPVSLIYYMAVGHAELRYRLGKYESSEQKETCEWEEDDSGTWSCSKCEASWEFNNGDPNDNDMYYCPKCGRKIIKVSGYEEIE